MLFAKPNTTQRKTPLGYVFITLGTLTQLVKLQNPYKQNLLSPSTKFSLPVACKKVR